MGRRSSYDIHACTSQSDLAKGLLLAPGERISDKYVLLVRERGSWISRQGGRKSTFDTGNMVEAFHPPDP